MPALAIAQPNIALIKYWGKRDVRRNLPAVSSLSITLDALWTTMSVDFGAGPGEDRLSLNGEPQAALLPRVSACLDDLHSRRHADVRDGDRERVTGTRRNAAIITSECNFPVAAGLASSASAFAALVVAADAGLAASSAGSCDGAQRQLDLARRAGRASGSAARSLYGGFVELHAGTGRQDIDLEPLAAASDWPLEVVVAVTERGQKPVSSGEAMQRSAETSPFYSRWLEQQDSDLRLARDAVADRDFQKLADVSEHNCLKMHSVSWTSRPPIVYWNAATLSCMQVVRRLRDRGEAVFFTIDAGPQVKAVCLPGSADAVAKGPVRCRGCCAGYALRS